MPHEHSAGFWKVLQRYGAELAERAQRQIGWQLAERPTNVFLLKEIHDCFAEQQTYAEWMRYQTAVTMTSIAIEKHITLSTQWQFSERREGVGPFQNYGSFSSLRNWFERFFLFFLSHLQHRVRDSEVSAQCRSVQAKRHLTKCNEFPTLRQWSRNRELKQPRSKTPTECPHDPRSLSARRRKIRRPQHVSQ